MSALPVHVCDIVIVVYFRVCAYWVTIFIRGLAFTNFMAEVIATYYMDGFKIRCYVWDHDRTLEEGEEY